MIFKTLALATCLVPSGIYSFSPGPSRAVVSPVHRVDPSRVCMALHATVDKNFLEESKDYLLKCETKLTNKLATLIKKADTCIVKPFIHAGNHVPTLMSLAYFGLINVAMGSMKGADVGRTTLESVLTRPPLGSTTNPQLKTRISTLVTPPHFIFLLWPLMVVIQLITVVFSAVYSKEQLLTQRDLTSLVMVNLASSAGLMISSRASTGSLPLATVLILPLLPIFSGVHLRAQKGVDARKASLKNFCFQLFSSFTTLNCFMGLAVELQYGGRIPILKGQAEAVAIFFLALYGFTVSLPGQGMVKRFVHFAVVSSTLYKRLFTGAISSVKDLLSVSLLGTAAVAVAALFKLVTNTDEDTDGKWENLNDIWEKE